MSSGIFNQSDMGEEYCCNKLFSDVKEECQGQVKDECHGQIKEEYQDQMFTAKKVEEECCRKSLPSKNTYVCSICSGHFGDDESLVMHLRAAHGIFADAVLTSNGGTLQQQMRNVKTVHHTVPFEDYCSVQAATLPLETKTMSTSSAQPSFRNAEINANISLERACERNGSLLQEDTRTVKNSEDKIVINIPLSMNIETYGLSLEKEVSSNNAGFNGAFSDSMCIPRHILVPSQMSNKFEMHDTSSATAESFDLQMKHLEDGKRYQSPVPNKTEMENGKVDEHSMKHAGKELCTVCNRSFTFDSELRAHMRSHTEEKPFRCSVCGDGFAYKCSMKTHMMRTHIRKPNFQCTICDMKFTCVYFLQIHKKTHDGEILHQCAVCDKKFKNSRSLQKHMWIHTKEKLYLCSMCDKKFTRVSSLEIHERTHTGQKPFKCSSCNKSFSDVANMRRHARTHTGEKPYQCTICNKTYTQAYYFKVHMNFHNGVKPHQCTMCDKKFTLPADLKKHFRVHTGERPYQCTYCDKWFASYSNRKTHMETHNKEKADQGTM